MLKNINYNLIETISIISRSLYRYDTYIKDAKDCKKCQELWGKFKTQREEELKALMKEFKAHIDSGVVKFD